MSNPKVSDPANPDPLQCAFDDAQNSLGTALRGVLVGMCARAQKAERELESALSSRARWRRECNERAGELRELRVRLAAQQAPAPEKVKARQVDIPNSVVAAMHDRDMRLDRIERGLRPSTGGTFCPICNAGSATKPVRHISNCPLQGWEPFDFGGMRATLLDINAALARAEQAERTCTTLREDLTAEMNKCGENWKRAKQAEQERDTAVSHASELERQLLKECDGCGEVNARIAAELQVKRCVDWMSQDSGADGEAVIRWLETGEGDPWPPTATEARLRTELDREKERVELLATRKATLEIECTERAKQHARDSTRIVELDRELAEAQQLLRREQAAIKSLNEELENINLAHVKACGELADARNALGVEKARTAALNDIHAGTVKALADARNSNRTLIAAAMKNQEQQAAARKRLEALENVSAAAQSIAVEIRTGRLASDNESTAIVMCAFLGTLKAASAPASPVTASTWDPSVRPVIVEPAKTCETCAHEAGCGDAGEPITPRTSIDECWRARPPAAREGEEYCKFCGKGRSVVKKLIAAPDHATMMCDECVRLSWEIVTDAIGKPQPLPSDVARVVEAAIEWDKDCESYVDGERLHDAVRSLRTTPQRSVRGSVTPIVNAQGLYVLECETELKAGPVTVAWSDPTAPQVKP